MKDCESKGRRSCGLFLSTIPATSRKELRKIARCLMNADVRTEI